MYFRLNTTFIQAFGPQIDVGRCKKLFKFVYWCNRVLLFLHIINPDYKTAINNNNNKIFMLFLHNCHFLDLNPALFTQHFGLGPP